MKTYTDEQLQRVLAKMLPEVVNWNSEYGYLAHNHEDSRDQKLQVLETELLHLCWLAEEALIEPKQQRKYAHELTKTVFPGWSNHPSVFDKTELSWIGLHDMAHANWQQRTVALAETLGIEIV